MVSTHAAVILSLPLAVFWPSLSDKPVRNADHTQLPIHCLLTVKPNLFCLLIKK